MFILKLAFFIQDTAGFAVDTDKLFGVFKYNKDSKVVELFDNFCYDYTERMKRLVINEINKLIESKPSVLDRKERCGVYYDIKQWGRVNLG